MENSNLFDFWVRDRLHFTDDNRRACFETAHTIVAITQDVRRNGLLSLDGKLSSMDSFFLRTALQLAVDNTSLELIRAIMQNWIISGDYRGKELLERIIILEGVISILNGEPPTIIREKLGIYIGEDLYDEYKASFDDNK
jgi:flagellar motor component MotA